MNSDIEYILKDATFQIQNFKDFVHQNAQKELDMKILEVRNSNTSNIAF